MIYCSNHRNRGADFHCGQCESGFCKDCVNLKVFDRSKVTVCPSCANPVTDLGPFKPVPPFWTRTKEIFLFPIQDEGWMMLLGWAIAAMVLRVIATIGMRSHFFIGWIGGAAFLAIYYSLLVSYFYRVVARAEEGRFDIPEWTEFRGVGGALFWPVIQFNLASVASFWPAAALAIFMWYLLAKGLPLPLIFFGFFIAGLLGLAGLFLLPMSLLLMGVFRNVKLVFNPLALVFQVKKIPKEYAILLGYIVGLLIVYSIVGLIFYLILTPFGFLRYILVFPVDGVLQLYLFMVLGHLLGYAAYQTRFKLKWWPETIEEPIFMVQGKPASLDYERGLASFPAPTRPATLIAAGAVAAGAVAAGAVSSSAGSPPSPGAASAPLPASVSGPAGATPSPAAPVPASPMPAAPGADVELARSINDGMSMLEQGRHQEAAALFKEILDREPNNLGALRGMVMAAIRQKDAEAVKKYADRQAAVLIRQKAFEPLWEMYGLIRKSFPDFSFQSRIQMMLARWLSDQLMDMEAAKALRELAVKHPEDPLAPKALYQCGEILWKKCGKKEAAQQMFDYLLKRYPDVGFADQVNHALLEIKSGR